MSASSPPRIIVDTREQLPYEFSGVEVVRKKLDAGDYSLEGHETVVAVERKSKQDAYQCVGSGRRRFELCLDRLSRLDKCAVVIEADLADFASPPSYTKITAAQAVGSFVSWSLRFRVPVWFCGDRARAERITLRWLYAYWKHGRIP